MQPDEMLERAKAEIENYVKDGSNYRAKRIYENFLDGHLISVEFDLPSGTTKTQHVYFTDGKIAHFKSNSAVLTAVAHHKERNPFFRLLSMVGVGGLIALSLILIFAILLCVLAFSTSKVDPAVIDIVKLTFSLILGFFFGSQIDHKRK